MKINKEKITTHGAFSPLKRGYARTIIMSRTGKMIVVETKNTLPEWFYDKFYRIVKREEKANA